MTRSRRRFYVYRLLTFAVSVTAPLPALAASDAQATPIKVACVGEQTTHSDQLDRKVEYPAKLQSMLGPCAIVQNFGDCCATVLLGYPKQAETHPYLDPPMGAAQFIPGFHESVAFAPDVVVIGSWGKHDTEIASALYGGTLDAVKWQSDYDQLVSTYLDLPSKPTVYVSTPIPIPSGQPTGVTTTVILPAIQSVATKYHLGVVPLYAVFLNQPQLYKDSTHPTDVGGLQAIAGAVYATLVGGAGTDAGTDGAVDQGCGDGLILRGFDAGEGDATAAPNGGTAGSENSSGGIAIGDGSLPAASNVLDGGVNDSQNSSGAGAGPRATAGAGCACRIGRPSDGSPGLGLLGGVAAYVLARRRRRRLRGDAAIT